MDGTQLARFREDVERILKERTWSRRTLAAKAGLNPGTVSKFLRGVGPRPEAQTVLAIAQALGLQVNQQPASTSSHEAQDFASGYKEGWKDGWDAAVRVLRGGHSGSTPSPP